MKPLRIRIDRIVDFGPVVSLVGTDLETAAAVSIHVDHRPFAVFENALNKSGLPPATEYEADRLQLNLNMLPADDAKEVRLVECAGADANANDHPLAAREIEP